MPLTKDGLSEHGLRNTLSKMTTVVNEAVIQFTEAKIELYEIIEVESLFCSHYFSTTQIIGDVRLVQRASHIGGGDEGCSHPYGADDQDHQLRQVVSIRHTVTSENNADMYLCTQLQLRH